MKRWSVALRTLFSSIVRAYCVYLLRGQGQCHGAAPSSQFLSRRGCLPEESLAQFLSRRGRGRLPEESLVPLATWMPPGREPAVGARQGDRARRARRLRHSTPFCSADGTAGASARCRPTLTPASRFYQLSPSRVYGSSNHGPKASYMPRSSYCFSR